MISRFDEFEKLFGEIDESIEGKARFFVIGGAMLLYYGIKSATKDIDVVIDSTVEFRNIEVALKKLGFETKIPTFEYKKTNLNQIFIRDDFRVDLFQRIVCDGFVLSKAMMKRAKKIIELRHLTIFLCSNEDVLLFKTFTEREGDIDDCIALAKMGIDWDAVLDEIRLQIKISGHKVWITWIGERLDILQDRGLQIPIMNKINEFREEYFAKLEKAHESKVMK